MRLLLALWVLPLALFWGWYGLSANDINFGFPILSRPAHDQVFAIYANVLHQPAERIPGLLASAFAFDSLLVMAIVAFRYRARWLPKLKNALAQRLATSGQAMVFDPETGQRLQLQVARPAGRVYGPMIAKNIIVSRMPGDLNAANGQYDPMRPAK